MSKTLNILIATALATVAAGPVAAAQQGKAIAPPTRAQLVAGLDARFKGADTNGDGNLSTAEIDASNARAAQQAEAAITQKVEAEFAKLDTNKDKQLSLAEYKAALPSAKPRPATETLGRYDSNKDGKISTVEFGALTLKAYDMIDTNKDGTISAAEQAAARKQVR